MPKATKNDKKSTKKQAYPPGSPPVPHHQLLTTSSSPPMPHHQRLTNTPNQQGLTNCPALPMVSSPTLPIEWAGGGSGSAGSIFRSFDTFCALKASKNHKRYRFFFRPNRARVGWRCGDIFIFSILFDLFKPRGIKQNKFWFLRFGRGRNSPPDDHQPPAL